MHFFFYLFYLYSLFYTPAIYASDCQHGKAANNIVNNLFIKYSKNTTAKSVNAITLENFESLVKNLMIGDIYIRCSKNNEKCKEKYLQEIHSISDDENLVFSESDEHSNIAHRHRRSDESLHVKEKKEHENDWNSHVTKCLSPAAVLKLNGRNSTLITKQDFFELCPSLIEQVESKACLHKHVNFAVEQHEHDEATTLQVWGYGFLSITIISLLSLSVISIIPCLKKQLYHKVMAYLVALAVGTLAGDALLHLIPHAFAAGSNSATQVEISAEDQLKQHYAQVWRALFVLIGIYMFFTVEQIMKIKAICSGGQGHGHSHGNRRDSDAKKEKDYDLEENEKFVTSDEEESNNKDVLSCQSDLHDTHHPKNQTDIDGHYHADTRHHHHHHGEKEITKETKISSVAWMVIVGDGFHNLTDGLAVGVAFSASLSSGLSTAIAVFCHELPHELGDFAILINSGMTIKQAIVYNLVSALLAYVGLVIGIFAGEYQEGRHFILSLTAGLFLYISLADMLPELTHQEVPNQSRWSAFIFQHLGILSGIVIMLFISLYEHII